MTEEFALSGPELQFILELLKDAHKHLLVEIRRTDTAEFRAGLKARLALVESLIDRTEELSHAEQPAETEL